MVFEQNIALGIVGVWLLIITIILIWLFSFFRHLTRVAKTDDIKKLLDKLIEKGNNNTVEIEKTKKAINQIINEGMGHVQKVGLIRFNHFNEIGGDHSFSLAILDGGDNGIIITGLHTRDRTRIYAKQVNKGKSDLELSTEEQKALLKAQRV
jgi:hypothetical protein